MALTAADAQAVAKALLAAKIPSLVDGKPQTVAYYLTKADQFLYQMSTGGDTSTAMQALVVAALQSPAGQAAIRSAVG